MVRFVKCQGLIQLGHVEDMGEEQIPKNMGSWKEEGDLED